MMNEVKKRPFVFISYAHVDKPFVTRLITDLESNNVPVWIDHEGIPPGSSDWEQDIRNAVNAASAIILIASPQARSSRVVRDELAVAKMYKRPIYPLWASGTDWIDAIPLGWGYTQYIDARNTAYEAAISQLITSLKKTLAVHSTPEEAGLLSLTSTRDVKLDNVLSGEHRQLVGITHYTFQDWGEAPSAENFYGRDAERDMLEQWILSDNCRVVLLQGIGGIGKTTLAVKVTEQVQGEFEYIFWRSLQNALPLKNVLEECILFLSNQQETFFTTNINDQISMLIRYLKGHRCLLVLDNFETILQERTASTTYRKGYEDYELLVRRIGTSKHQSCLLLTSREKPGGLASLEGKISPVRVWRLSGLTEAEGRKLLDDLDLRGSNETWAELIQSYSGNPLYLKIVSELIRETFSGDINKFQESKGTVPGEIKNPLEEQFSRLSPFEQEVLYWLAIEREAVSFQDLQTDIASPLLTNTLPEVLNSLRRRSLIENNASYFFLQPVVMEYTTEKLIKTVSMEILGADINLFGSHALMKALSKDYVRESQIRLILRSLVEELKQQLDKEKNTRHIQDALVEILVKVRNREYKKTEYAGGNILNLLIHMNCDLSQVDFSCLKIRQAFLQGVNLQDTNFSHVNFVECTFTETFGNVMSVAFSAKNRLFAASGANADIRQWYAERYVPSVTYQGHSGWVFTIAFNPDGNVFASGGEDQTARLWDTHSGLCLKTFQHTFKVRSVAFSPDGCILATSGDNQAICLWNVATGERIQKLFVSTSTSHRILSIAFSPDGCILASGGDDKTVSLWNINTEQLFLKLVGYEGEIRSVAFNREGTILVSGSDDGKVYLWEIDRSQLTLSEYSNQIRVVTFSNNDKVFTNGSNDEKVSIWEIDRSQCLFPEHNNRVRSVAFNNDDSILATSSDDQTIRLWDVASRRCIKILQGHTSWVGAIDFDSDGDVLASGSDDQTIRLWDVTSGHCLKILQGYINLVESIAFSSDGQVLASGSSDHTIRLWDTQNGFCLKSLHGHSGCIRSVAFSQSAQIFASAGDDYTIRLWNSQTNSCLKTFHGHTDRIWSLSFSPVEPLLASSGEDKTIRLWNIQNGQYAHEALIAAENAGWIWSISFSPDGRFIASGSDDQIVRLWNIKTKQCIAELHGHTKRVWSVAFNTDGKRLASGSEDGTVLIWDIDERKPIVDRYKCIAELSEHNAIVKAMVFLPNENIIVDEEVTISNEKLVTSDWNLHVWEIKTENRVSTATGRSSGTVTTRHLNVMAGHSDVVRSLSLNGNVLASSSQDGTIKLWDITTCVCLNTLRGDRLYENMNITEVKGLTEPQKDMLENLGAVSGGQHHK